MPRKARKLSTTNIYHIMIRGNQKQDIFLKDEDKLKFIDILKKKKQKGEYELYAYCLMNNHVHLLIKEKKDPISRIMQRINISYVNYFNHEYQQVGHLFQGRFNSEPVEDENYLLSALSYIHKNPEEAFLVKNLEEYPWSSYYLYTQKTSQPSFLVEQEYILSLFSSNKDMAMKLLTQYHNENIQKKYNFIDLLEGIKNNRNFISQSEIRQYIQNYLKRYNFNLSNLRERKYQSHRDQLINYLRQNSNLSIRGIANVLKIGISTVQRTIHK
ncbi:MAG: transposase [Candidatus Bathyarchaeota archaeon]|nr:transposase [Candidatus Bathyarchaeota archaeon]